jgi:glycosyltransferase involved in cell wall biosynthesis
MHQQRHHILHVFDGFRVGGTELRTCRLIEGLGDQFKHTICSLNGNFDARSHLSTQAEVHYIQGPQGGGGVIGNLWRIRRMLKSIEPDLLITYSWGPIDWLLANSILRRCAQIQAEEGFEERETFQQIFHRLLLRRLLLPRASKVITCSENLKAIALQQWRLAHQMVEFIPNGVDTDRFVAPPLASRSSSHIVKIGFLGSLIALKNPLRLMRIVSQLPDTRGIEVVFAGEGPERETLERYTAENGLSGRVRFLGRISDTATFLQTIDILCTTSDTEQMPLSVLEAMSCGLAVVGTAVGDVAAMVAAANKPFITHPERESEFAHNLGTLIANRALREELGAANAQRCREVYSMQTMVSAYNNAYRSVIDSFTKLRRSGDL